MLWAFLPRWDVSGQLAEDVLLQHRGVTLWCCGHCCAPFSVVLSWMLAVGRDPYSFSLSPLLFGLLQDNEVLYLFFFNNFF